MPTTRPTPAMVCKRCGASLCCGECAAIAVMVDGNQGIKLVRDSVEFGGKTTQVTHRQRERAFDANDIGAPPNHAVQLTLVGCRGV
ncbi:MAG: hypothetical protein ABL875_07425 [Candidatus Nitrotoga sp.]